MAEAAEDPSEQSFPSAPDSRQPPRPDRRLFRVGSGLLVFVLLYYGHNAKTTDPVETVLGLLIIFLAALPSLLWAKQGDTRYPIFEIFLLTTANVYAIPLLNGHEMVRGFRDEIVTSSALAVVLYQVAAIVTYRSVRGLPKTTSFWTQDILSERAASYLSYGMLVNTVYIIASTFYDVIPVDLNGIMRAVCSGIGILCAFVTMRTWGMGQLTGDKKAFFAINLALQVVFQMVSLYLVSSISLLLLGLLGYVSASRRLPVLCIVVLLPVIALLHNGKSAMREKYWAEGVNPIPPLTEVPAFYAEWIGNGLNPPSQAGETNDAGAMTERLLQRTSLFHLMCLVVEASPDNVPFLDGETYQDILIQLIPRPLWPDKPNALAGTYRLAIYYGLQTEESAQKTSIGFGMLTEAYANFGFYGLAGLGVLFGFMFKKVQIWTQHSPIFSYPGLFLVLLVAWSFQTEFTLSVWISSMFQAAVAIVGIPFVLQKFLN